MRWCVYMLLVGLLAFGAGCAPLIFAGAGAGAGIGTYAYIKGALEIEYPRDYEEVWNATLRALEERNNTIEGQTKDGVSGTINARRPSGTAVKIKVVNKGTRLTTVNIRIGTFGDQEASMAVKDSIDRYLGVS